MTGTRHFEDSLQLLPSALRPRPQVERATILQNNHIGGSQYRLLLSNERIARDALAGEFVMITVPGTAEDQILLPRPMAIHRRYPADDTFEVIFKIVGRGTKALSAVPPGTSLLVTGPLGNGFSVPDTARSVLLIGRGIGVCSVMSVAEDAKFSRTSVFMVLSGRHHDTIVGIDDCVELGVETLAVNDVDGSSERQHLERVLHDRFDVAPPEAIMVCGSVRLTEMAIDLAEMWQSDIQVSLEANMACGIGYCHGCAAPMKLRPDQEGPLVCIDGPVFRIAG